MLPFSRKRLIVVFVFVSCAVFGMAKYGLMRKVEADNSTIAPAKTRASAPHRRAKFNESIFTNDAALSAVNVLPPLDPSGDPDLAFSNDGKVRTNFAEVAQFAEARGVGIQSDGKIIVGGFSYEGGINRYFALLRLATDGTQDFSFGNQDPSNNQIGVAKLNIGVSTSNINDLAVYPVAGNGNDDKIVGVGFSTEASNEFAIARFTKNGALDTTFGSDLHPAGGPRDGYIEVDFAGLQDRASAVAIQDDGKIIVVGFAQDAAAQRQIAVVRLNADGTLDPTFSGDGKATVDFTDLSATADDRGTAVAIRGTGANRKIVIGGWTKVSGVSRMLLVQFTDTGVLDTSFGDNSSGKKVFAPLAGSAGGDEIRGLTLDASGKIVACGYYLVDGSTNLASLIARFTTTGALDTTFNTVGYTVVHPSGSNTDTADRVKLQSDGKIVTIGYTPGIGGSDISFTRLTSSGVPDSTYGSGTGANTGVVKVNVSDADLGYSIAIDSSNRAVGVGRRLDAQSNGYILAARVTTAGVSDNTFGPDLLPANGVPDGFFITQLIGGSADEAFAVAQAAGKTVLAGYTWGGSSYDVAVMRYDSNTGALDTTFSGDGKATAGQTNNEDIANAVAIQPDNKVVTAGDGSSPQQFTVMRFTDTGTQDNTFGSSGVAKTTIGTNSNNLFAIALQPDGKIVVGGTTSSAASSSDFALLRFTSAGNLDTSFDTDGKVTLNIGTYDQIKAIALQPDGKIVVGGSSSFGNDMRFSIARFNTNGSLDTTFNSPTGYFSIAMSDPLAPVDGDEIRGIAVMSDGKIVAAGKALNYVAASPPYPVTQSNEFALLRLLPNGTVDNTFGTSGKVTFNATSRGMDEFNGIALQFDDKIVAFGSSMHVAAGVLPIAYDNGDLAVARFNWDNGSLDTTYSDGSGFIITDINGHDRGAGGVVYADGKTLGAVTTGGEDFGAGKFLGDPNPTAPTVAPDLDAASDSGRFNNDNITNDNTPTFTGTCVNGETMVLKVGGADTSPRSRAICRNSAYAVTVATPLADGTYSFTVVSTNSAGASAASPALGNVVIDTVALPPTITLPAAGSTVLPNPGISGGGAETLADVVVKEGGATVCSDPNFADASGGAWSCASMLGNCSHTITAIQTDLAGNTSSGSATRQFYVKPTTTTTLTQNLATTVFGQQASFTASVTSTNGPVTGFARFTVDAEAPTDVAVTNSAVLNRSNLSVGNHNVTVSFLVNDCFQASTGTPNPIAHTVIKADTTTPITSSANPSVFGQSVMFSATVSAVSPGAGTPTGTLTFQDNGTPIATCTSVALSAAHASCSLSNLSVGNHSITTVYAGDTNFNGSNGTLTGDPQGVNKANTSVALVSATNPSIAGQSVTFTATISVVSPGAGTPSGTFAFLNGGNPVAGCESVTISSGQAQCMTSALTVGSHTMSASYSGDGNFNTSSGNMTGNPQVVNKAPTSVALTSAVNPSVFGQNVTLTATVSVTAPGTGMATGTVSFLDGGNPITGCTGVALSAAQAQCMTSALPVGNHTLTASYSGDASFNISTGSLTGNPQVVNKANTSVAVASSANPSVFGQPVTFTANVSATAPGSGTPTGTVAFLDGGNPIATCTAVTLSAGAAQCSPSLAVGNHTITAQYTGDGSFNTSNAGLTGNPQVVGAAMTTTVINTDLPDPSALGENVIVTYTVAPVAPGAGTPTGTVTVTADTLETCSSSVAAAQCSLALNTSGARTLTAVYVSDTTSFSGSTSPGAAHAVNKATPTNTATNTPTDTATPTPKATDTATATPTATNTPTSTATATSTDTPTATPTVPSIAGTVTYGNAIGTPTPRAVPDVQMSGAGSPPVSTVTDTSGKYLLTGFGSSAYTVTPSKMGGQNGAITGFDAALISQHIGGPPLPHLAGNQLIVADVSGNGVISSFDAGEIAHYLVSSSPAGSTGSWIFNPVNRMYASVITEIMGEDYSALLMGEVSGNWSDSTIKSPAQTDLTDGPVRNITVELSAASVSDQKSILVPVNAQNTAHKGIISYEFDLRYDPTVIQPAGDPVDLTATISRGLNAVVNSEEPGLLRVVVYGPLPITENGLLVNLRFVAVGKPGSNSPLTFERIMFNEGDPGVTATAGQVELF